MHACSTLNYSKITCFLWQMESHPDVFTDEKLINVKLSGDGARFSWTSNFILLLFSLRSDVYLEEVKVSMCRYIVHISV